MDVTRSGIVTHSLIKILEDESTSNKFGEVLIKDLKISLSKDILLEDISDTDKLWLLKSLLLNTPLLRDSSFRISTRERALKLKQLILSVKQNHLELW